MAETLNTMRGSSGDAPPPVIDRAAPSKPIVVGVAKPDIVRDLYGYDRVAGHKRKKGLRGVITRPDRASDSEYMQKKNELDAMFGMLTASDEERAEYDDIIYLCYALLGGSQVSPTYRGYFTVGGVERSWKQVSDHFGVAMRRSFRTVADEIVDVCRYYYKNYDPNNPDEVMIRQQIIQLADMRGLSRFPWLVADVSDAAYNLSADERAAAVRAKSSVVGNGYNGVDRRNLADYVIETREAYDSTNGEVMAAQMAPARGAAGGGLTYR